MCTQCKGTPCVFVFVPVFVLAFVFVSVSVFVSVFFGGVFCWDALCCKCHSFAVAGSWRLHYALLERELPKGRL